MSSLGSIFVRWRVRMGYPLALAVLFFARPNPRTIFFGALAGIVGLGLRAWAAGYLHKQEVLTITGPYAYTRNPLYLGSAFLVAGTAIAAHSWRSAIILILYFFVVYSVVMRKEENELRPRHRQAFERYAAAVPQFFPRLTPAKLPTEGEAHFSAAQYRKNHEWQAALGFVLLLLVLVVIWRLRSA